jgi:hypothetical protein
MCCLLCQVAPTVDNLLESVLHCTEQVCVRVCARRALAAAAARWVLGTGTWARGAGFWCRAQPPCACSAQGGRRGHRALTVPRHRLPRPLPCLQALSLPSGSLSNPHRLDTGTEGLLVLARSPAFARYFGDLLQASALAGRCCCSATCAASPGAAADPAQQLRPVDSAPQLSGPRPCAAG